MARAVGSKDYIGLTKGLITEASPLAFPEQATTDELNFELDLNGLTRSRRKGFEDERTEGSEFFAPSVTVSYENVVYWQSPDVFVFLTRVVGSSNSYVLRVLKNDNDLTLVGTYSLDSTSTALSIDQSTDFVIITTGESTQPLFLEYLEATGEIRLSSVELYVRDFELLDDSLDISERPTVLADNHLYNLYNTGWWSERILSSSNLQGDPVLDFFNETGEYPSNADVASLGLKFDANNDREEFDPDTLKSVVLGNTEAPRGHFVYGLGDFERNDRITPTGKLVGGASGTSLTTITTWNL